MKGLLIKDWKLLLRNQKSFLVIMSVMMVLYMAIGNPVFVISYTPMLCVFVALSTITYDMFDNGAAFLFSLPFSRKDYVREKYIFSGLITLTAWGISVLVAVGYSVVKGEDWKELLMTAGVLLDNGNPAYGCIRTTAVEVRGRKKPRGSDPGYGSDVRYGDWIF